MRAVVLLVAIGSIATPARAQQVTITIGGYGPQQQQAPIPPAVPTQHGAPSNGNSPYAGPVALAQMAAYGRYMQYLTMLNYQSAHNGALPPGPDAKEYFTNGAAATTVPSAGPGSAYFNNGSEATVLPSVSAPPAPPPPPVSPPPPSAGPSPWVVVYQNPAPPPPAPAPPPVAPPPVAQEPVADTRLPVVAMSFQDWLESMGMSAPETADESTPTLTSAEVESAPIAEPAALSYDVRQRAVFALPEKARVHLDARAGGWGPASGITGAFAAGLILGGLAMLRLRDRARKDTDTPSTPPPSKS